MSTAISRSAMAECTIQAEPTSAIDKSGWTGLPSQLKQIIGGYLVHVKGCIQYYSTRRDVPWGIPAKKLDIAKNDGSMTLVGPNYCEVRMQLAGETQYYVFGFANSFLMCNELQAAYLYRRDVAVQLLVEKSWPGLKQADQLKSEIHSAINGGHHGIESVDFIDDNK